MKNSILLYFLKTTYYRWVKKERKKRKKLPGNSVQHLFSCELSKSYVAKRTMRGFTFVEMIIGLAFIGIVSAVALPAIMPQLSGCDIEKNAKEISTALMVARIRATKTQMPHRVKFDLNSNPQKFVIQRGITSRGATTWIDDIIMNEMQGEVKINRVDDVKVIGKTCGICSVEFGPIGNPTRGMIYLEDGKGEKYTITLNVTTGKVSKKKG